MNMNKVELLPKDLKINDKWYQPRLYITAWGKWCIAYKNMVDLNDHLCSVCVEPENEPRTIESTIGYLNEYIGNAKTLDDACDMITNYINKNFINS